MSEVYATSLWLHGLFTWALAALLAWHLWLVFWHAPKASNLTSQASKTPSFGDGTTPLDPALRDAVQGGARTEFSGSNLTSNLELNDAECKKYRKMRFAYARRLRLFLPTYYLFLGLLFFTGILNLALIKFQLNPRDWGMIALFVPLVFLGVLGFSKLKKTSVNGEWASFKRFMLVKILSEFAIITLASALGGWF